MKRPTRRLERSSFRYSSANRILIAVFVFAVGVVAIGCSSERAESSNGESDDSEEQANDVTGPADWIIGKWRFERSSVVEAYRAMRDDDQFEDDVRDTLAMQLMFNGKTMTSSHPLLQDSTYSYTIAQEVETSLTIDANESRFTFEFVDRDRAILHGGALPTPMVIVRMVNGDE